MSETTEQGGGPQPAAPPPAAPTRRRRRRSASRRRRLRGPKSLWARLTVIGGAIAAIVVFLLNVTSLYDWISNKVNPPPPASIDPHIEWAKLELRGVPLIDYLQDTHQTAAGLTAAEKREPGLQFLIRVRLEGEQGRKIPLHWRMYPQGSGRRLDPSTYSQTPLTYTATNQDHSATTPIWVPYPKRPGRYTIRFSLLDEKRQPLDEKTTDFVVRVVPKVG